MPLAVTASPAGPADGLVSPARTIARPERISSLVHKTTPEKKKYQMPAPIAIHHHMIAVSSSKSKNAAHRTVAPRCASAPASYFVRPGCTAFAGVPVGGWLEMNGAAGTSGQTVSGQSSSGALPLVRRQRPAVTCSGAARPRDEPLRRVASGHARASSRPYPPRARSSS